MAEIKLKKREEMDPAYCWDLSSLFGSDEEFEKTEQELAKKILQTWSLSPLSSHNHENT